MGPGGRGDRPARPGRVRAARSAGSMTRGPDLQAGVRYLAYGLVPVNVGTHRASRTPSMTAGRPRAHIAGPWRVRLEVRWSGGPWAADAAARQRESGGGPMKKRVIGMATVQTVARPAQVGRA